MTEEGAPDDVDSTESLGDGDDAVVKMYEELFADRYSATDDRYQDVLQSDKPPPPCVRNWFPKQNRNFDRNRGGGGGRGYHQRDNYGNRNYGNQQHGGYRNDRHYQGHRDQGHRDQGHRDQGQRDQGHRDQGHRDQGHRDQGHRDQGRYSHHQGQGQHRYDRRYQPY